MQVYKNFHGVSFRTYGDEYVVSCGLEKVRTSNIIVALQYYSIFIMRLK
ncbi:hypothetical protein ACQ29_gp253 [Escherichia phage PBECO4]|uniref:Uncharacterized protein n=1 Tax=Escherichia phage PBECO4 TaxID=1273738 RepID=L7TLF4_9CAUD|nr:hypothetical protein ACQ29_gp253 [Escherichia phage PBECO4]AGC34933.1 hypothetical protein [Escherichia phage PBECO4]